ncbi:MAG: MBL fold metallo-hydrolase [Humidesulfovibrio sp.]|uniref:MBL fold metallo-hydrolase n=1 Tax=Humidesulfovibrio sp. TaxID=2910988 RepID=UPI0027E9C09D|nr:MBL fold metallo-hydrolase [Humidesulfovibrio sp.]MDQ7836680.1 MBL fold metallo-hydrolase [Humidesulfovibrio sp.]
MKINFLGAAQAVTGSCYILETGGHRFSVDCGMHQGNAEIEKRNLNMENYRPSELDFVLVTHAHIDHIGLLPRIVAEGFKGNIYATPPTRDLMQILLLDSAHIQEMEAEQNRRKVARRGNKTSQPPYTVGERRSKPQSQAPHVSIERRAEMLSQPLYTTEDAMATIPQIKTIEYNKPFEPVPGIRVTYRDAGHILGSAFIEIEYLEDGKSTKLVFSGDLGRPNQLILPDPSKGGSADYVFLESTYGDRDHKSFENSYDELATAIAYSYKNHEKVIIPAFAVERTQQILYTLFLLSEEGKLPKDMPVYLDSPLAIQATEIFRSHPDYFDAKTQALLKAGKDPLALPNLRFSQTSEESRAINNEPGSAVVISASGMANAGRIRHHLRHNLWRKGASVVFCGYQGEGTPGRKIVDGAKSITIFGEEIAIAAKVFTIGGFSAHAGQAEIMQWLRTFDGKDTKVILIHGEVRALAKLSTLIHDQLGMDVHVPSYLEELTLQPGKVMVPVVDVEKAAPRIDWDFLISDSRHLFEEFQKRMELAKQKPWVAQTEIRDRFLDLNRKMVEIISEL